MKGSAKGYRKILIRENLFYVTRENWDQNTPSNFPGAHLAPNENTGKKGSIARDYPKV